MYRILCCVCFVSFIQVPTWAQKMDDACATKVPDISWEREFELLINQNKEKNI